MYSKYKDGGKILVKYDARDDVDEALKGVVIINDSAFAHCTTLISVDIPNSVIEIGEYAFYNCSNLTDINIPNSVIKIDDRAFWGCSSLTSVNIPNSVTEIGWSAFHGCSRLASIEVDKDNPNFKSIEGNLYNKDATTLIQYSIGKSSKNFSVPNSVTEIGSYAFASSNLTDINIPNSVIKIDDRVFHDCSNLASVNIPNSVTEIGLSAFYGCSSLTSVNIPNSVTEIGAEAFADCKSLSNVKIPKSVNKILLDTFDRCVKLDEIIFEEGSPVVDKFKNSKAFTKNGRRKITIQKFKKERATQDEQSNSDLAEELCEKVDKEKAKYSKIISEACDKDATDEEIEKLMQEYEQKLINISKKKESKKKLTLDKLEEIADKYKGEIKNV